MEDRHNTAVSCDGGTGLGVLARVDHAVFALNRNGEVTYLNEAAEPLFGPQRGAVLGETVQEVFSGPVSTLREEYTRALETQRPATFSFHQQSNDRWFEAHVYPSETGVTVDARDITDRKQRERMLQTREHALYCAYEIIADPTLTFTEQISELLEVVKDAVGTEYATLSRVEGSEYHFEFVDAPDGDDLAAGDTVPLEATNCEYVIETDQTLVLNDVKTDAPHLADRAGNAEWGISCYLGAPVTVEGEPYGTFCFYSNAPRREPFTDWQVTFVDLFSKWVSNMLEQQQYLERITVLNDIYEATRSITSSIIEQASREEIETAVCTHLVGAATYSAAWFATIDQRHQRVVPRSTVGLDGMFDAEEATYDISAPEWAPVREAMETGSMQVIRDIQQNPEYGVWHERAQEHGFRSWAVVPVCHDGVLYGVLNIYATHTTAFSNEEQTIIRKLGELVGHAITSIQRKRSLMSGEVVEMELSVRDFLGDAVPDGTQSDPITFERTVPVGKKQYLIYGVASERGVARLQAAVDARPSWESVTVLREQDAKLRFELKLTDPPILTALAARGGRVKSARIEDGDYQLVVQLPHTADVREFVDAIQQSQPTTTVLSKRQQSSEALSATHDQSNVLGALTERQRAAVESAFHSGYFDWPRQTTGEEIAASWDVSPPTFHQHLRSGEQKILRALFPSEPQTRDEPSR